MTDPAVDPARRTGMDLDNPFRGSDAVRDGDVTRAVLTGPGYRKLGPDTFVSAEVADSALLRVRALLVRGGPGAVSTGWSACVAQGLDVASRSWPAEIAAPGQRLAPHPGTVVWQQRLPADDVTVHEGVATTTPVRTAFDLARRTVPGAVPGRAALPLVDAVVAADALARLGGFAGPGLASFARRRAGIRGVRGVGPVAELLDPGADSPPETRLRLAVVLAGLPRPVLQFEVERGPGRWPWRLDLAWPEFRVALEYDGHDHAAADRRGRDLDRLDALRRDGWLVIVVTARQAARRGWVADRVREAMVSRGWADPRTPGRAAS